MKCIKTGFYASIPGNFYLYGDAFVSGERYPWPDEAEAWPREDLILRVTSMSDEKPHRVNLELRTWEIWLDENKRQTLGENAWLWQPSSTLIANSGQWSWLGYKGAAS